jgi:hypothetical protein
MNVLSLIKKYGILSEEEINKRLALVRPKPAPRSPSITIVPRVGLSLQSFMFKDGSLRCYFRWRTPAFNLNLGNYISPALVSATGAKARYVPPEYTYVEIAYFSCLITAIDALGYGIPLATYLNERGRDGGLRQNLERFIKFNSLEEAIEVANPAELQKAEADYFYHDNPAEILKAAHHETEAATVKANAPAEVNPRGLLKGGRI